jgi:hypothetical protein
MELLLPWKNNNYYIHVFLGVARVALLIQHATHRRIVICGLSGSTIFFDIFL